jgi:hypothetical protein
MFFRAESGAWQLALRMVASKPASYWSGHSYQQLQVQILDNNLLI